MRKALSERNGIRKKFIAVFSRFGKKVNYSGYSEPTILLTNITDAETKTLVTDHLWFSLTKGFEKAGLTEGVTIEFEARVKEYTKGYVNRQLGLNEKKKDFKLSHPTNIRIIE
jgi:superfamily I DNA and/or RNA helicase